MPATITARDIRRQSLNLGWTFPELSLPDRMRAAADSGFRQVECHFPYAEPLAVLQAALRDGGLGLVSINAPRGEGGQLGLASIAGAGTAFRSSIDLALRYARELGAERIHVLAGDVAAHDRVAAEQRFVENLKWAAGRAGDEITLLIEPLNTRDRPAYLLTRVDQAARLIDAIGAANVRILFDTYQVALMEGDPLPHFHAHAGLVDHVQIAGVPDHHEPDEGIVDYHRVYDALDAIGYGGAIGAEYFPRADTRAGLVWMDRLGILR